MRMESRQTPLASSSRFAGLRIHFIGIGGCGMAGLARMMLDAGAVVSGSDLKPSPATLALSECGAKVVYTQDGGLLDEAVDLVVRTAAIPATNAEYARACQLGLSQVKYAELIGQVMRERLGIAVSGTHGKTTTSSMAAWGLLQCDLNPSFVIGGTVRQLGGSSRSGAGRAFVVEACEFDRSFHNYNPSVAVITNIEADHLDCYPGGIDEIIESFAVFADRVPETGLIIANGQDAYVRRALANVRAKVEWVGLDDAGGLDWAVHAAQIRDGCHCGAVYHKGHVVADLRLSVPGLHNLFNATAAIAACAAAGADPRRAAEAIGRFTGADRRMSQVGQLNGATIVDDYGHHPTEIRTTLRALRERYRPDRLICIFQPHQFSRTRLLMDDFAGSFGDADQVVLPDIYASRDTEADRRSVSAGDLADRINLLSGTGGISSDGVGGKSGDKLGKAVHVPSLSEVINHVRQMARPGDLILTMGAGNISDVGQALVAARLENSEPTANNVKITHIW